MTTSAVPLELGQCEREALWLVLDVMDEFQRGMSNHDRARALERLFHGLAERRGLTEDTHWKRIADQVRRDTSVWFLRDLLSSGCVM